MRSSVTARIGVDDERAARQIDEGLGPRLVPFEALEFERREVERRLTAGDELGDVLADSGCLLKAVPEKPVA